MSKYHLTDAGPKLCTAEKRPCPVGGNHYEAKDDAASAYYEKLAKEIPAFASSAKYMELPCAFGTMRVVDGDLSDIRARTALISGLCGSLAAAVQKKSGGDAYFVCYGVKDEIELAELFAEGNIYEATHALVESKSTPGMFMDAYGRKSQAELEEFYGEDITVLKGTPEMLKAYSDEGVPEQLENFADSVMKLDEAGTSYSYLEFELE